MSNNPSSSAVGNTFPLKHRSQLTADRGDTSVYSPYSGDDSYGSAGLSPGPGSGYGSMPGMDFNTVEGCNTSAPLTPHQSGISYDTPEHHPKQLIEIRTTTCGNEPTQGTNFTWRSPRPSSVAQKQQAIRYLVGKGTNPMHISDYLDTFESMDSSGNFDALATLEWTAREELDEMIKNIVSNPTYPVAELNQNGKRKAPDEVTTPRPQASKRPRTLRKGKEPAQPTVTRRGCPGNSWACKPDELKQGPRKYWDTRGGFFDHFDAEHLEDCRVVGNRWQCPVCERPSFGGDGYDLKIHMWDEHWD